MIAPHVPTPPPPIPNFPSSEIAFTEVAETADTHVRRRQRGGLIVDLDDTLYPREQFVLSGLAAVARHVAGRYADHKGPRRTRLDDPRSEGRISADAAFTALIDAYDGDERGREFQALCRHFDLPLDIVPELVSVLREHRPSLWLRPGVVDTLQQLRRQGWRIAILTNGMPAVQASKIAALELAQLVDFVLYAEQHAPGGKPARATFQAALAQLNLRPASCICVGDDPACDVRGGRAAGLRTVRVARPDVTVSSGQDADAVIDRFEDLPAAAHALLNLVNVDVA
jgi:putative hydrolase of the HAD superfamily